MSGFSIQWDTKCFMIFTDLCWCPAGFATLINLLWQIIGDNSHPRHLFFHNKQVLYWNSSPFYHWAAKMPSSLSLSISLSGSLKRCKFWSNFLWQASHIKVSLQLLREVIQEFLVHFKKPLILLSANAICQYFQETTTRHWVFRTANMETIKKWLYLSTIVLVLIWWRMILWTALEADFKESHQ